MIQRGLKFVFGLPDKAKVITGLPAGRLQLVTRQSRFARCFIFTRRGRRQFHLLDEGERWRAVSSRGRNLTGALPT